VASGDFNGDGFADLAIGVPVENVGTVTGAGATAVLYGSTSGLQATNPDDQLITQDTPGVMNTSKQDDRFGFALAAGDFNGDGFADVAIGIIWEDIGTATDAGAVAVIYVSASRPQFTTPDDQFWNQDSPNVADAAENNDAFGWSLASTG